MAMRDRDVTARRRYDDQLRRRLTELLSSEGLQRPVDVDHEGQPTGATRAIPVEVTEGDGRPAFAAADRVIVPAAQLDRARSLVMSNVDEAALPTGEIVSKPILGTGLYDLRTPFVALPPKVAEELVGPELRAHRNHLLFASAYSYRVREGDDPENAPLPERDVACDAGRNARVAILDTGLARQAASDPWLGDVQVAGRDVDVLRASGIPTDDLDLGAGHGTFVAGIVRQIAPAASIEIIRVLDSNGIGLETEIARGLARAIDCEADIVLCAFGGYTTGDEPPSAIEAAVADVPKHAVIVAAAGNEHQAARPLWPASCRGVEAVAALESDGDGTLIMRKGHAALEHYTNTGPDVRYGAAGRWMSSFVAGKESPLRETDGHRETFVNSAIAAGSSFAAAAVAGAIAAAMDDGCNAVEAWDHVRSRSVFVAGSPIRGIDVWSREGD